MADNYSLHFARQKPYVGSYLGSPTAAFDYYISPTGNDSNPGTFASPWAITSLTNPVLSVWTANPIGINQTAMAGKRVGLLPGTYNVYSLLNASNFSGGSSFLPYFAIPSGTASHPTVVSGIYPPWVNVSKIDATNGGTYLTNIASIMGQYYLASGNSGNVTVDSLEIMGSTAHNLMFYYGNNSTPGNPTSPTTGVPGIGVNSSGVKVLNCYLHGCRAVSSGYNPGLVGLWGTYQALVHNCKLHDAGLTSSEYGAAIMSYSGNGNIYEYNTIYDCNKSNYDKFFNAENSVFRYNYVENTDTTISSSGPYDGNNGNAGAVTQIYNNVIIAPHPVLLAYFSGGGINAHKVFNNTFVILANPADTNGWVFQCGKAATNVFTYYNNIISNPNGLTPGFGGAMWVVDSPTLIDYNLYPTGAVSGTWLETTPITDPRDQSSTLVGRTFANWQSVNGFDLHGATGTPSFVNPITMNPAGYKLNGGSPGQGTGSSDGTVSGSACDMGAWGGPTAPTTDGLGTGAASIGCSF